MTGLGPRDERSFGVIGLGVMGQNLALNLEEHGVPVVVWNRASDRPDDFLAKNAGKRLVCTETLEELTSVLDRPRRILLMVKAGSPVDDVLDSLLPHLAAGDVVLDGGNSAFTDTRRRQAALEARGVALIGIGISGGEAGLPAGLAMHLAAVMEALELHMQKEEQVLFPLIRGGRGAMAGGPVSIMEREHDEHAVALRRTRELTGDLQSPAAACTTWRALYLRLAALERDLMEHIHLENNVLFPRALGS